MVLLDFKRPQEPYIIGEQLANSLTHIVKDILGITKHSYQMNLATVECVTTIFFESAEKHKAEQSGKPFRPWICRYAIKVPMYSPLGGADLCYTGLESVVNKLKAETPDFGMDNSFYKRLSRPPATPFRTTNRTCYTA